MQNVCSVCGLPLDLCSCKAIEKSFQKIRVFVEKRKFNKPTTIIDGITNNVKEVLTKLKSKLACGGTFKNNHIELQGDHRNRLKEILKDLGYKEEQIEII
jgi:translation initiation factor 1